jgi:homoserine O-succinyltransferase/O-acetyltransferase
MMPVVTFDALLHDQSSDCDDDTIIIGLVNNMPDSALRNTERQFRELLSTASENIAICLKLFSLPELSRAETGRSYVKRHYEDISELWANDLDGLIVTGTEPRAPDLAGEPYWPTLTKLVEWAEEHTVSTIWSCLAAHAAVLHIDGVGRRPLGEKLSGIFESRKETDHALMLGIPSRWRVPHSRYNELPEEALVARGYRIVARSADVGADIFVKQRKSLFVFLQGHPEYDPDALLREYRRDVRRFVTGERDCYPEIPRGCFDEDTTAALVAFQQRVADNRRMDVLLSFPPRAKERSEHEWRELAVRLYGNWLSYLAERKSRSESRAVCHGLHEPA